MKALYWLLLALCLGVGGRAYWSSLRGPWPAHARPVPPTFLVPRQPKGTLLGVGTVTLNRFYPLLPVTRVPVRYIYVIAGQHVRKGEVLAKFEDHTYVVARAAGIITEPTADPTVLISDSFPRLWLTETAPFRLRLPLTGASVSLCPGQQVRVKNRAHPPRFVTGKVGAVLFDKLFMIIDLRLQTVGAQPLSAGTQVLVEALPPHVE